MRLGVLLEQCLAPVPGGTARYSRELAAALVRRAAPGDAVEGWTAWHRSVDAARVDGVAGPRRLPLPRRALVAAWERGTGPSVRGDVVLAPTPLHPPRRRTPLAVVVHDAVAWTHPETLTSRGAAWHRTAIARAARDADLVVTPTRAVAEQLARHVELRAEVAVVGEGVTDALALPPDADARAARLDLPERFLLVIGTREPRKGVAELLAALEHPDAPRLPLLLVGQPGWGTVPGGGRELGRLPDADLAVCLHRATALVVPSRDEGFGLPLLEGMAAGVPVVASRAPALVEVAGGAALHTGTGPAELAAALRRVVEDDDLRDRLRAAGRARAAAFTWDGAADALWPLLRRLGAAAPRRGVR